MYAYLKGILAEKNPTEAILDVGGVGFQVTIPVSTYTALPEQGSEVFLRTHLIVREDVQALYGFSSEDERELFRLLISVSGIGPKLAITILSGIGSEDFKQAIKEGSLATLTAISGIGKKTAERMILELREKIIFSKTKEAGAALGGQKVSEDLMEDSLRALVSLGYKKNQAKEAVDRALQTIDGDDVTVESIIRVSLKHV